MFNCVCNFLFVGMNGSCNLFLYYFCVVSMVFIGVGFGFVNSVVMSGCSVIDRCCVLVSCLLCSYV